MLGNYAMISGSTPDGVWKLGGGMDFFVTRNWVLGMSVTWVSGFRDAAYSYTAVKTGITYVFR